MNQGSTAQFGNRTGNDTHGKLEFTNEMEYRGFAIISDRVARGSHPPAPPFHAPRGMPYSVTMRMEC